jgi:hypothetical protein
MLSQGDSSGAGGHRLTISCMVQSQSARDRGAKGGHSLLTGSVRRAGSFPLAHTLLRSQIGGATFRAAYFRWRERVSSVRLSSSYSYGKLRMTRMLPVVGPVLVITLMAAACGGGSNNSRNNVMCGAPRRCPGDPPDTALQVQVCEMSLNDPACGALYQVLLNCLAPTERCAADGGEDVTATLGVAADQCGTMRMQWNGCVRAVVAAQADASQGDM